jgi:glycerol-3-phosphate acyltransferase PlsY
MDWLYASLIGYFFGSIPTAWLLCRIFYGINIFEHGSKNMGSTNVYRTVGGKAFAANLAIDVLKGMVPVLISAKLWPTHPEVVFAAAACAMIGHTLSFWVKFKGGKGVATGLGVFIALSGYHAIYALAVFLVVLLITRMVSVSSMTAATALPFFLWYGNVLGDYTIYITVFAAVIALFVIYKHKSNILRIIKGTESKLPLFAPKTEKENNQNTN